MQISVIIPTWNRSGTLCRALDSVFAQTLPPLEIIIVDDGSIDGTATRVQQRYPQCQYIYQEQKGVSAARNLGIRTARGDWIAFLDSDDEWLPTKLESQRALLDSSPACRLCHTEEIWIRNGKRVNPMRKHAKSGGWIYRKCLPLCVISPSSVLIRKELFDDVGMFDETLPACEDYDLWLRVCARVPVGFVETPQIIKYGGHADQLSRKHWGMDRFRIQALSNMLDSGILDTEDARATRETLAAKAGILADGAAKRGNLARARHYRQIQRYHLTHIQHLAVESSSTT